MPWASPPFLGGEPGGLPLGSPPEAGLRKTANLSSAHPGFGLPQRPRWPLPSWALISAEQAFFRGLSLGEAKKAHLGQVFAYLTGSRGRFCKRQENFLAPNSAFTVSGGQSVRSGAKFVCFDFDRVTPVFSKPGRKGRGLVYWFADPARGRTGGKGGKDADRSPGPRV